MDFSLVQRRIYVDTFAGGKYHHDLEENLGRRVPAAVRKHRSEFVLLVPTDEQQKMLDAFRDDLNHL